MKRIIPVLVLCAALVSLFTGCGGGEQGLGSNSSVEITVEANSSGDMQDIEVITAPKEGWYDDYDACSYYMTGFGCSRVDNGSRYQVYNFTTQSYASDRPYYVWVLNHSDSYIDVYLEVKMDGDVKRAGTVRIAPKTASHQMNIYRNNADWY